MTTIVTIELCDSPPELEIPHPSEKLGAIGYKAYSSGLPGLFAPHTVEQTERGGTDRVRVWLAGDLDAAQLATLTTSLLACACVSSVSIR